MAIQVYVNGHEWLARKLRENGIAFTEIDNSFLHIDDMRRAQIFAGRKRQRNGRTAKAFNPLAREDLQLFHAVMDGADTLHGFTNRDVRVRLERTPHLASQQGNPKRQSAKVSRVLHRFHAHGLVAKIPRSRRWRTTRFGRRLMATAIQVRELNFPQLLAHAA